MINLEQKSQAQKDAEERAAALVAATRAKKPITLPRQVTTQDSIDAAKRAQAEAELRNAFGKPA